MHLLIVDTDITLRELYEKDAETLFQVADTNRAYLRAWLPWLDQNKSVESTLTFIQHNKQLSKSDSAVVFGIWYRHELAGVISFNVIDTTNHFAIIGYWLAEKFQGNGITTKACAKLVEDALITRKLNRVEIHCAVENQKSRAIPERLGFTFEGILRQKEFIYDHYKDLRVYSLLAQDYIPTMETV
jgi:ribosomal-protein-serine acetyltransferase